jgi:multiple sugar transport system ATP-binding protein
VASISLEQVGKVYPNGQAAVRDLTIEIANGELLVLVGPSGSGKSTVLRLIAGLETASSGRILIGGADVTEVPPARRDLAMVFQSYALYPHMTVRQNLAFGLRVRRIAASVIESRVQGVAAMLGIEPLLDRLPAQLSGGQRQRVALGRAIVREPNAFLLDEPLSNLDPVLRTATRIELALLHRRLATTTVYVTHDQEEAMTLGTRVAVMRDGVVEQIAPALEVFQRPANTFVAGFVGWPAMNLWPCTYESHTAGPQLKSAAATITLARGRPAPDRSNLVMGVRPHEIELTAAALGDGSGRIAIAEPLGSMTIVHLRVEGLADLVRVAVGPEVPARVDDTVGFRVRRDGIHVFDAATGQRVG